MQNVFESSLGLDIKAKQDLDLTLIDLKKLVAEKKVEVSHNREIVCYIIKASCVS